MISWEVKNKLTKNAALGPVQACGFFGRKFIMEAAFLLWPKI